MSAIRIPIEFVIDDLKQKEQLEKDIDVMNKKVENMKQAVPTISNDNRGGIFGGSTDVKEKFKDKTSAQPFKRQNEFKKVQDKISGLEKSQKDIDKQTKKIKEFADLIPLNGGIPKFALKFAPIIGQALFAVGFVKKVIDELIRDGGLFDRRLKIKISRQFLKLTSRRETAQLSSIEKTLRVTTISGLRGSSSQQFNTQSVQKRGLKLYSLDQEAFNKSVLP